MKMTSRVQTGPIKLIHLVRSFRQGGMENGVANLVNHLDRQRFDSAIYVMEEEDDFTKRVHDSSKVVALNQRQGNDPMILFHLARRFCQVQPTIVHTHGWGTLLEGFLAAKLARVPIVVHGEHGTIETRRRNLWVQRLVWPWADQLLSVSEVHRQTLAKKIGVPISRIKVIPNGVDLTRYRSKKASQSWRSRYRIPTDHLVVGSVGRLVEVKQYHHFLMALAMVKRRPEAPPCSGVLVGDGPLRDELTVMANDLGIQNDIYFLGHQDEVPELLSLFDIFVLTSRSEGMSNTILEAMATGLPVVATDVGGASELVLDGETGRLIPPGEPERLAEVLTDLVMTSETRCDMGQRARKRAADVFSLSVMVEAYEALYTQLTDRRRFADRKASFSMATWGR